MNNNSQFNYYVQQIINYIYEQKMYKISYNLGLSEINKTDINETNTTIDKICAQDVIIDIEDMISKFINLSDDNYLIRKAAAIEKNYLYPILYEHKGIIVNTYSDAGMTLWKHDMDELYKSEIYSRISDKSFKIFVKNNFLTLSDNIITFVKNEQIKDSNSKKVTIECKSIDNLLDSMKNMILNKTLGFEWAEFLVDMNRLRNDMLTFGGNFDIYSEFEKLSDDTKYCLDNYCKYNSKELYDVLTNEKGFIWKDGLGLLLN